MLREFKARMKIVANSPVRVFIASYIPRYWYPYRLQHAENARDWARDESLELIIDSAIGDADIGNEETLDRAYELNADYVIPNDTLQDQQRTTEAVREFVNLYEDHPCRATPLITLQPPYDQHYRDLAGWSHYVLGGIALADPDDQLAAIRRFREAAGYDVYAHGLGLGASVRLVRALRDDPRLLDSFDLSTPEQVVKGEKLPDESWKQREHHYPRGQDSSTVRAAFASAVALQLNYMLGPLYEGNLSPEELRHPEQSGFEEVVGDD